jgi:AraC-like DNA-binding protein
MYSEIKRKYKNEIRKPKEVWPHYVKNVYNNISNNIFSDKLKIEKMIGKSRVSRSKLYDEFKYYVGKTPRQFVIEHRVEAAKLIMNKRGTTISSVAFAVGYASAGSFCSAFEKKEGVTPGKWKE